MGRFWRNVSLFGGAVALALALPAAPVLSGQLSGQRTKMPSTLRYGSGLLDVPVAGVLPHLAVTGTFSAFRLNLDSTPLVGEAGAVLASGGRWEGWMSDASVAVGLFNRLELGASLQSFGDPDSGGTMVGGFGRLALLRPEERGLGVAVGGRYVSSPSFSSTTGQKSYLPPRLGFPDSRFRKEYGGEKLATNFSPYLVVSALMGGLDSRLLPRHDLTLTLGYGSGMFNAGEELTDWYSFNDSEGFFAGTALHILLREGAVLALMGEYNGFDVNVGAQVDIGGLRLGAFALGTNHRRGVSAYRSTKFGLLISVSFCAPSEGLCKPALLHRPARDTVLMPAPPPDTVVVSADMVSALITPAGEPMVLCLATGQGVRIQRTTGGDTLVGPDRVSIRSLRPAVVFSGAYAEGRSWFATGEPIFLGGREYRKAGIELRLECTAIERVGEHGRVPLFALRAARAPYAVIYVPAKPGIWEEYRVVGSDQAPRPSRPPRAPGSWHP
jgi:hypothetical protein